MSRRVTYAEAGVDRRLRADSKKALRMLKETYKYSRCGRVVELPYGKIFPVGDKRFLDLVIEGVGTKVLVAQLAGKYDTIGIDGVAMAVNDVIRSGATPLAVADNIHTQRSDPRLVGEWMKGLVKGAAEAECIVPSGEIGDVSELVKGLADGAGFDMVVSSIGEVTTERIISGRNIESGDAVIGMRSSGIHSNGVSLARKILFKQWGGRYEPHDVPEGLDTGIIDEVLVPTKIYVKPLLKVASELKIKAAVHITGDAYLKFDRLAKFSPQIGFDFQGFDPQPIFHVIQKATSELGRKISDEEMFKTFNMGWGFAVIVQKAEADEAVDVMERAGVKAKQIGTVVSTEGVRVAHEGKKIHLK